MTDTENNRRNPGLVTYTASSRSINYIGVPQFQDGLVSATFEFTTGLQDSVGNPLPLATIATYNTSDPDALNIDIGTTVPVDGADDVPGDTPIQITFGDADGNIFPLTIRPEQTIWLCDCTLAATNCAPAGNCPVTANGNVPLGFVGIVPGPPSLEFVPQASTVTFKPKTYLRSGRNYEIHIGQTVASMIQYPNVTEDFAAFTVENGAPAFVSCSPPGGSTGLPTTTSITITFDENIDPASATSTTIGIEDLADNQVMGTYATTNNEVTFTPSGPLLGNTDYRVELRAGPARVTDTAGNALVLGGDTLVCLFTTEALAPVVMGVEPADAAVGVALDTTIAVRFSEPMSLASLYGTQLSPAQTGTVQLSHTDQCLGAPQVLGCISMSKTLTSLYFDPVSPYQLDGDISPYRFALTDAGSLPINQPTDLGGLVLPVYNSTFDTADGPPVVSCIVPADGSTIGTVGDNIVVHFNEPVAFATFNGASFRLFRLDDGSDVPGTFPIVADGTAMEFDPTADLAPGGVDYELIVDTGVQDVDGGSPLAHIYRATFNTP